MNINRIPIEVLMCKHPINMFGYYEDEPDGYTRYYSDFHNKRLKYAYYVVNSKLEGLYEEYDDDGILWRTTNYVNDIKDGPCIEYYKNGSPHKIMYYANDIKLGPYEERYEDGSKKKTGEYINGELDFKSIRAFDTHGNPLCIIQNNECITFRDSSKGITAKSQIIVHPQKGNCV